MIATPQPDKPEFYPENLIMKKAQEARQIWNKLYNMSLDNANKAAQPPKKAVEEICSCGCPHTVECNNLWKASRELHKQTQKIERYLGGPPKAGITAGDECSKCHCHQDIHDSAFPSMCCTAAKKKGIFCIHCRSQPKFQTCKKTTPESPTLQSAREVMEGWTIQICKSISWPKRNWVVSYINDIIAAATLIAEEGQRQRDLEIVRELKDKIRAEGSRKILKYAIEAHDKILSPPTT